MCRANIVGYHCNDKIRCDDFVENKTMIIDNRDIYWLGKGMYFWDNKANARYWHKQKIGRNENIAYKIVEANIDIENILDLTDEEICNRVGDLLSFYTNRKSNGKRYLGELLDMLFERKGFDHCYGVIKVYGKYKNMSPMSNKLFSFIESGAAASPTFNIRCVYNVKKKENILAHRYCEMEGLS